MRAKERRRMGVVVDVDVELIAELCCNQNNMEQPPLAETPVRAGPHPARNAGSAA
jgi:hypothetical protein